MSSSHRRAPRIRGSTRGSLDDRASNRRSALADALLIEQSVRVDDAVHLDVAVREIDRRVERWRSAGLQVGEVTWRDQGLGWPPTIKTNREDVVNADSIGIEYSKGSQGGAVVLFKGGWC
jgi:hypothetical protein